MSTQVLLFNLPLSPKPNAGATKSVMHDSNGWTLSVFNGGSSRSINTSAKTVNASLAASHYSAFCGAFQGNSGSKSVTVTYSGSTVQSIAWDSTTIALPDGGSFAPVAAALAAEASDAQQDSSRLG